MTSHSVKMNQQNSSSGESFFIMDDLMKEIILNLRAIIISKKGGVDLSEISDDYKDTFGVDIPVKSLGCTSVKELIQNHSENFMVTGGKVQAVTKPQSNHIVTMISKQKSNKGKKRHRSKMTGSKTSLDTSETRISHSEELNASVTEPKNKRRRKTSPLRVNPYSRSFKGNSQYKSWSNWQNNKSVSYENLLNQLCLLKGLMMPFYNIAIRKTSHGSIRYDCDLRIGSNFWVSTYPSEARNEIEAKELASKKAILSLTMGNMSRISNDGGHVSTLHEVCWKMNLPEPVYNSYECRTEDRQNFFISEIFIGDKIFNSSYPTKAVDIIQAQDLAAKKALEYLNFGSELLLAVNRSTLKSIRR